MADFIYPEPLAIAAEQGTVALILVGLCGMGMLRRHRTLAAAHP
jgi:hypothetical protein